MRNAPRAAAILIAALSSIAAPCVGQGKRTKGDGGETKVGKPAKDDPITAKDGAIVAVDKFLKKKVSTKRADWKTTMPAPPELKFTAERDYFWHVQTSKGVLVVQLFWETAPKHVASTIYLSRAGFYDGLTFPRVLKGFMAQGGSPLNSTAGNAGYTLDHEFETPRKHERPGALSAANADAPNTDGSQFFLTFAPAPHLDGKHTVYGQVIRGLPALEALEACGVAKDGDEMKEIPHIVATWIQVAVREKPADQGEQRDGKDDGSDGVKASGLLE